MSRSPLKPHRNPKAPTEDSIRIPGMAVDTFEGLLVGYHG